MKIAVGSTNPAKLEAVRRAVQDSFPKALIVGIDVLSGVSLQPMSDDETERGAENRARAALKKIKDAEFGIGLEGGVHKKKHSLMSTVWCCVVDRDGNLYHANGARFYLPPNIAQPIMQGEEMGPLMDELSGESGIRQGKGMIGVVTKDYVSRSEEYGNIAKLAIGLWYGRSWNT